MHKCYLSSTSFDYEKEIFNSRRLHESKIKELCIRFLNGLHKVARKKGIYTSKGSTNGVIINISSHCFFIPPSHFTQVDGIKMVKHFSEKANCEMRMRVRVMVKLSEWVTYIRSTIIATLSLFAFFPSFFIVCNLEMKMSVEIFTVILCNLNSSSFSTFVLITVSGRSFYIDSR